MRSISTVFIRDRVSRLVINKLNRSTDWVQQGKGVATRKYDGIAVLVEHGKVYLRHEWRPGTVPPVGFTKSQQADPKHPEAAIPGWYPVPNFSHPASPQGVEQRALKEAWEHWVKASTMLADTVNTLPKGNPYAAMPKPTVHTVPDGTYELCGPKIRGNHESFEHHILVPHGIDVVKHVPRNFEGLKKFFETFDGEGIVWHYKTGNVTQMAKVKRRDFGFYTRLSPEEVVANLQQQEAALQQRVAELAEDIRKEDSNTVISTAVAAEKEEHVRQA